MRDSFIKACHENNHSLVKELLCSGADVNCSDNYGWSGLHIAACYNYRELLELLLAQTGVDVNIMNSHRKTPLMMACDRGNENFVRLAVV